MLFGERKTLDGQQMALSDKGTFKRYHVPARPGLTAQQLGFYCAHTRILPASERLPTKQRQGECATFEVRGGSDGGGRRRGNMTGGGQPARNSPFSLFDRLLGGLMAPARFLCLDHILILIFFALRPVCAAGNVVDFGDVYRLNQPHPYTSSVSPGSYLPDSLQADGAGSVEISLRMSFVVVVRSKSSSSSTKSCGWKKIGRSPHSPNPNQREFNKSCSVFTFLQLVLQLCPECVCTASLSETGREIPELIIGREMESESETDD
ncbi:hypothetical protein Q8A73_011379 [Channa argus]|nr:hypothetical protein Q8A73_011379 [Channa argus]